MCILVSKSVTGMLEMRYYYYLLQKKKVFYVQIFVDVFFIIEVYLSMSFVPSKDHTNIGSNEFIISWYSTANLTEGIKQHTEIANWILANMRGSVTILCLLTWYMFQCRTQCPKQLNTFSPNQSLSNVKF